MIGIVRSASLTNYAEVARKCGLDPARMLREFKLPARALDDPETILPAEAVRALLEASAQRSGVEGFALLMAEHRRLSALGPLGLLVREAPTLRLALEAFVEHGKRLNQSLCLTIEEAGEVVVLRETIVVGKEGSVRQATELAIGVAFRTLQQLLGPAWRPRRVCFAHDAPTDRSIHERLFGRNVEFGHDFNGIVCAKGDLVRANPEADPELARLARKMLDTQAVSDGGFISQVRDLVVNLVGTGTCTIDRAAQHLGVDRRTIHRRLAREHETFSGIVDAVRRELAERYLEDRRPVSEIASLLGFSASSGFSHWYRRQYDAAPSSRRAKASRTTTER